MDQDNIIKIYARNDNRIQLKMIPGHFVTSQSHITHYLDLTTRNPDALKHSVLHPLSQQITKHPFR